MGEARKESPLVNVDDVRQLFGLGISSSYKIIRQLNDELKAQGYKTFPGKVPKDYLYKRYNIQKSE